MYLITKIRKKYFIQKKENGVAWSNYSNILNNSINTVVGSW